MILRQRVGIYIRAKKRITRCQGKHMKQLCHLCLFYSDCITYKRYVDAWIRLQEKYKKGK